MPTSTSRSQCQIPVGENTDDQYTTLNGTVETGSLWKVTEAASFLNISPGTLFHWVSQRKLPCIRFGSRCLRFDPEQTKQWAKRHGQPESCTGKRDI
jgi:excisionase family DNA binding protein